jgi:hypothetical protein
MRNMLKTPAKLCGLVVGFVLPLAAQTAGAGPCEQIKVACESAGFVKGDARQGYGLWRDCVDPIMRGTPQPANADKQIPAVPPDLVAACRQVHPNFGEGHRGPPRAQPPPPSQSPPPPPPPPAQ